MSEAWCERATDLAEQAIQRRKPGPLRDHVLEACLLRSATLAVCRPKFDSGNARCENVLRPERVCIHVVLLGDAFRSMRLQATAVGVPLISAGTGRQRHGRKPPHVYLVGPVRGDRQLGPPVPDPTDSLLTLGADVETDNRTGTDV
jgi:hypothetical protein